MSQSGKFIFNSGPGSFVQTLTGNSGGAVPPTAGNIDVLGDGITIDVVGNPGTSTLTISAAAGLATTYTEDVGSASPVAGNLNIIGAHGINTLGAVDTVTVAINNAIALGDLAVLGAGVDALTITTGDVSIVAGNLNLPTTADANTGVIEVNGARFIHSFGGTNTFVGGQAGNFTMTGFSSVGIGAQTLSAVTSGAFNCAGGFLSQNVATSGSHNSTWGSAAMAASTGASSQNTAIGSGALNTATTPNNVIALGYLAASAYTTTESNNIIIGNIGTIADSARIRIGTNATHTSCFVAGIDGVNVGSTAKVVTLGTAGTADQLGTASITAGAGITVTPGANTITIAATGSGFTWSVVTIDAGMVVENGYIANKAGLLTMTLPATAAIGDSLAITGINTAVGWRIAQNANQRIHIGAASTTIGVGGYIESTAIRDSVEMVCVVAGASTEWNVRNSMGNITVV